MNVNMNGVLKITDKGIVEIREPDKLVPFNDPILRKVMPRFDFIQRRDAIDIANRLIEFLKTSRGLGLAAPQIGIEDRVFVMGVDDQIVAYFNPIILDLSDDKIKLEEGCISFPSLYLKIERPSHIYIGYDDYMGKTHHKEFDGITARIFQHEMDHLDGKLFTDHVGETSLIMAKTKQKKLLRKQK